MSIIETNEKMSKKMIHWKNDSGEIDVFEAAKYFSNANEEYYSNHQTFQNNNKQSLRGGRMSFDMPQNTQNTTYIMDQKPMMKNNKDQNKKYKQPSSPGGRLASFLNSLFNQTSSKKKKSSKSLKDHEVDESPNGRRKRRSSISHFSFRSSSITTTTTTNQDSSSKSIYSSSNSGFRTPPPYAYTPTKSYKEMKYNQERSNLQERLQERTNLQNEDYSWLDEKLKLNKSGDKFVKNNTNNNGLLLLEKNKTYNKVVNVDDEYDDEDGDSDSSSDLFDLPNIDLDCYYSSSGLPVYETTNMDNIKRGTPISSGAI